MNPSARILLSLSVALSASACSGKPHDSASSGATTSGEGEGEGEGELPANAADAVATYAQIVSATYEDSLTAASRLDSAIDAFLAAPSDVGFEAARQAWLDSREPYLQTEVFRFYDGPIDHPDTGPEGLINAWPLDEQYIDYVEDDVTAGIVNDTSVPIDAATLMGLNESGGEKNIATGFHAIEFLLWGQDLSDEGPGDRPHTDFDTPASTAANPDRRATYLAVASDLLLVHLSDMTTAWATGGGNYRAELEGGDTETAIQNILTGMIVLSGFETGGERLQAAMDSGDQEDEHSCFSDNTHRDMVQDVVGVQNVWRGSYTRLDGTTVSGVGIRDVVDALDTELAGRVDARIDESVALAEALQPPFDQEIAAGNTEGRARVQALIQSLRDQEEVLFEVFTLLGLTVTLPE